MLRVKNTRRLLTVAVLLALSLAGIGSGLFSKLPKAAAATTLTFLGPKFDEWEAFVKVANEMGKDMGTRHRAGLGMSENSDAIVVIVSEETGIISMAKNGVLIRRLDRQNLFNLLQEEIVPPAEDEEADISPLQKLLRKGGALNHGKPE